MNTHRGFASTLAVAASLLFVVSGCAAADPVFDPAIMVMAVQAEVEAAGVVVENCDEPPLAEQEQFDTAPWWELGGELVCDGTLNGDSVELDVTVAPPVEGTIAVAVEVATPLFDVAAAASVAADRLDTELGGSPEVVCHERLVVIAPSRRIECRVIAEGGTAGPVDHPLEIVILDRSGDWEIDLFS